MGSGLSIYRTGVEDIWTRTGYIYTGLSIYGTRTDYIPDHSSKYISVRSVKESKDSSQYFTFYGLVCSDIEILTPELDSPENFASDDI
jgi:hypothetical protein